MPKPFSVFISYAHSDLALRRELDTHLSVLQKENIISTWTDSDIVPGTEWEPQVQSKLNNAQIILLLISADFINSQFCYSIELKTALKRHEQNTARVIPIIIRPMLWELAPFGKLQALPLDAHNRPRPVISWPRKDDAWTYVTKGIYKIAQELEQKENASKH